MDIVTLDWETYYDKDYSLSKLSTEEYVRDPRFEAIGVGIKINNHPTDWYSGENFGGFLNSIKYDDKAILCHNTAFDGAILSWKFGIRPKLWLDTMSMARPTNALITGVSLKALANYFSLGEKGDEVINALGKRRRDFSVADMARYAIYCKTDVDLTYALFKKLVKGFPQSELMVIDQTLRMFIEPKLELDAPLLEKHLADVRHKKELLLDAVMKFTGDPDRVALKSRIMSNPKFAELLQQLGVDPPKKISKSTGAATWAFAKTDTRFTALAEHDNPVVQAVVAARLGARSTIEETRTESFLGIAGRGTLPVMLNYYGAHTGRFSGGGGINLQNLTRKSQLRHAIKAPEGYVVIPCDSSQIEARMLAYIAGQDDLVEAFAQRRDIYSEFASEIYGRPCSKAPEHSGDRFVGKTSILGLGYGMGADRFKETLAIGNGGIKAIITLEEAQSIVHKYRKKYPRIAALWSRAGDALRTMSSGGSGTLTTLNLEYNGEYITLPNGLKLHYPILQQTKDGFRYINNQRVLVKALQFRMSGGNLDELAWTYIYGAKLIENITQALARIVISEQMARVGQVYPVVLQVHDELVPLVREDVSDEARKFVRSVMSTAPKWAPGLPVACEDGVGRTYGSAK